MRKIICFITIALLFASFAACNKDSILDRCENESDECLKQKEIAYSENLNISLEEAHKVAMDFMQKNSNPELRSGKGNEIKITECVIEDNDTLMYLVNFEEGYAIISGSTATYPVLGFADQNNLFEDDINNNQDLLFWFEYVKGQIKEALDDTEIEYYDPLAWEDITDYSATRSSGVGESGRITGRVGEELCLIKTNWGQGIPFNNSTPYVGSRYINGNAPAGCVAIAIGQILFYHKRMFGYSYDWNKLGNMQSYPDEMGDFIRAIGDGVSMVYGKDGSHPHILTKANLYLGPKDFLEHAGYKARGLDFSLQEITSQLDKGNPVYVSGFKESDFFDAPNLFKGHAWVCDAYVKRTLVNNSNGRSSGGGRGSNGTRASTGNTAYVYYLHFNWGWDGAHNGWFADGITKWAYDNQPGRNDEAPERTDPMNSNRYPKLLKILTVEK